MTDKLTYDELKLGERAKEAFLEGRSPEYIRSNCAVYLNTQPVFARLNVTDLAIAGVLAGMNTLLIGNTGCGKWNYKENFLITFPQSPHQLLG